MLRGKALLEFLLWLNPVSTGLALHDHQSECVKAISIPKVSLRALRQAIHRMPLAPEIVSLCLLERENL